MTTGAILVIVLMTPVIARACMPSHIDFGFGNARLDAHALAEVAYAAGEFRAYRNVSVRLIAQTDGSDSNVRMSRRRAQSVKAALVRRGVPARAITIEEPNASHAVITGDGYARFVIILFDPISPTRPNESAGCS